MRIALGSTLLAATALAALPPAAHADLKPGSSHPLARGTHLTMPLPTVAQAPVLTATGGGRIRVTTKVRYLAANWKGSTRVKRDRATVTFHVARRVLTTGPDPSAPRYRAARSRSARRASGRTAPRSPARPRAARTR